MLTHKLHRIRQFGLASTPLRHVACNIEVVERQESTDNGCIMSTFKILQDQNHKPNIYSFLTKCVLKVFPKIPKFLHNLFLLSAQSTKTFWVPMLEKIVTGRPQSVQESMAKSEIRSPGSKPRKGMMFQLANRFETSLSGLASTGFSPFLDRDNKMDDVHKAAHKSTYRVVIF